MASTRACQCHPPRKGPPSREKSLTPAPQATASATTSVTATVMPHRRAMLVAEAVAWGAGVKDFSREGGPFQGGWHWQALVLAMVEATLVVAGSLLLVA